MTIRITAAEVDTLVLATERPEPIPLPLGAGSVPINPMLFPIDWSLEVSLETRWTTDVTKSIDRTRSERWILSSRPARKLGVRVVGGTKDESHAMLQAAMDHTDQLGAPVPIFPDATMVTAFTSEGLFGRVYGDFRHRRFFVDGRVCFLPVRVSPVKSDNSVIFAYVRELAPDHIRVEFIPTAYREPTTLDAVAPCMDVELIDTASGVMLTDSVYTLEMQWSELEGSSTLPASWPAVEADSAEVLSPLCKVVDNLPIFPFDPNWQDGVSISPAREIDSDVSGRTALQEPLGKSYHEIEISVMGYNREACWKIARFFDAMRGRAGSFYLIHPQQPWTLFTFPSTSQANFKAVGSPDSIAKWFKKAIFTRANGDVVVRGISSVTALSEVFTMHLDTALPDTDFVSVQPVMVCSFDQDELVENWATTNVVPAFQLKIVETPDHGVVSLPTTLGYTEEFPGFLGIPNCNLLLRAGVGCLGPDLTIPATVWPTRISFVKYWQDVSRQVVRTPSKLYRLKQLVAREGLPFNNTTADLMLWNAPWQNNGQPSIRDADYILPLQLDTSVPIDDRHLWSQTAGWTLFLCFTPQRWDPVAADLTLFQVTCPQRDFLFKYDTLGATGPGRARLIVDGVPIQLTKDLGIDAYPIIVTLRFDGGTGGVVRIWLNGSQATASGQGVNLPVATSYSVSRWFPCFWTNTPTSSLVINQRYGTDGNANMLLSYDRALEIAEINSINSQIAEIYRTVAVESTLY